MIYVVRGENLKRVRPGDKRLGNSYNFLRLIFNLSGKSSHHTLKMNNCQSTIKNSSHYCSIITFKVDQKITSRTCNPVSPSMPCGRHAPSGDITPVTFQPATILLNPKHQNLRIPFLVDKMQCVLT
jgi:hypothetical protein